MSNFLKGYSGRLIVTVIVIVNLALRGGRGHGGTTRETNMMIFDTNMMIFGTNMIDFD